MPQCVQLSFALHKNTDPSLRPMATASRRPRRAAQKQVLRELLLESRGKLDTLPLAAVEQRLEAVELTVSWRRG